MPDSLKTYSFTVVLDGVTENTGEMADAIYEAGCDDAGVGSCDGVVTIDFDREAESLARSAPPSSISSGPGSRLSGWMWQPRTSRRRSIAGRLGRGCRGGCTG